MNKSRKKSYLISAATLALIFLLLLLVFRDALPDILANLRAVPLWGILLLLFMGLPTREWRRRSPSFCCGAKRGMFATSTG